MATQNIPYTFSNNTNANATEVNSNFQAIKTFNESQVVHVDGAVQATTNSYANLSVTGGKIADATITSGKFASGIQPVILVASVGALPTGTDGMVAYVNSNNADEGLYTFNGTAWRKGSGWNSPWGLIARSTDVTSNSAVATTSQVTLFTTLSFSNLANRLYLVSGSIYVKLVDANVDSILFANLTNGGNTVQNMIGAGGWAALTPGNTIRIGINYLLAPTAAGTQTFNVNIGRFSGTGSIQNIAAADNPSQLFVTDIGAFGAPS